MVTADVIAWAAQLAPHARVSVGLEGSARAPPGSGWSASRPPSSSPSVRRCNPNSTRRRRAQNLTDRLDAEALAMGIDERAHLGGLRRARSRNTEAASRSRSHATTRQASVRSWRICSRSSLFGRSGRNPPCASPGAHPYTTPPARSPAPWRSARSDAQLHRQPQPTVHRLLGMLRSSYGEAGV